MTCLSWWMMRAMASNRTAFLALECWTFLDFGGSWALLRMVSKHSVRRLLSAASSAKKTRRFKPCRHSYASQTFTCSWWTNACAANRSGRVCRTWRRVALQQAQQFDGQPRGSHKVVRVVLQVDGRRRHDLNKQEGD